MYKPLLPSNLLSSPLVVPSGITSVCCLIESSAAMAWEIELPEKTSKILLPSFLLITCLVDLTCTLPFSIFVSDGGFQPFSSKLRQRYMTHGKLFCMTNPTSQNVTGSPVGKIKQICFSK